MSTEDVDIAAQCTLLHNYSGVVHILKVTMFLAVGGASAWTDGGCCYGQHGYHGLIRISYKQSECSY